MLAAALAVSTSSAQDAAEGCFACHPAPGLAERIADGQRTSPEAESLLFKGPAHADLACLDCHSEAQNLPHPTDGMSVRGCESCHTGVKAHVLHAPQTTDEALPKCADCHGHHAMYSPEEPISPVHRSRTPGLCGSCHQRVRDSLLSYSLGVHGMANAADPEGKAAVCTDCHGAHPAREGEDLLSGVERAHLPNTCGQCHEDVYHEYESSVHGVALAEGSPDAPICTSCHGEHTIMAPDDPSSPVSAANVPETCGQCHAEEALSETIGVDPVVYETYRETYHGIANSYGGTTVAHCASCHGAHDIRSSDDPDSSIHATNLATTCGECHPGISDRVASGRVHLELTPEKEPIVFWVAFGFKWLTIGTMMALIGHIILDIYRKVLTRMAAAKRERAS